ncbi:MAG: flagellar biosynthesis protein FlhF [Clostridia bacterium]|nr:flagellar biosynthesis protein FlhF [Clostridia bacterium]
MNVKRYIAPNVQEAMIKIKHELGRDAIILHTRKIKQKGIKGLFKKPLVEVVAAVEDEEPASKETTVKPHIEPVQSPVQYYAQQPAQYQQPSQPAVQPSQPAVQQVAPVQQVQKSLQNEEFQEKKHDEIDDLKHEIDEIKEMLRNYIQPDTKKNIDLEPESVFVEESKVEKDIKEFLKALDLQPNIIEKVFSVVRRQVSLTDQNEQMVKSAVRQAIKEYLGEPFIIDHYLGTQRVFVFVGPTGVGKTTTLAKLAAKLSLIENKKVGLVTADTYRIAAVDQLKTYSEILGIPLSVVYEASELNDVMYKYADKDVILLDTAGRSHKSDELARDLQDLINNLEKPEIFLVLSLTTGYKDIISILEAYSFVEDYKIIFTKLDEASTYSNILNIKVESGRPLSYVTTGQSVPDDIEVAYAEKIVEYIIGEIK